MMHDVIHKPELGTTLADFLERAQRIPGLKPAGMSVGQEVPSDLPGSTPTGNKVLDFLNSIGVPPCRVWGADAPHGRDENGCPLRSKVCGAIYPYVSSVPANSTGNTYEMFAKVWFWPLYWVDVSGADIFVEDLEYTQDPVFENGVGTGDLFVPSLLGPADYYGFVPGLPAFDNKVPLVATLGNNHAMNAENFEGMFVGISIRN